MAALAPAKTSYTCLAHALTPFIDSADPQAPHEVFCANCFADSGLFGIVWASSPPLIYMSLMCLDSTNSLRSLDGRALRISSQA